MEGFLLWPVPQATRNAQRKSQLRSHGDFKECIVTWTRLPRAEPEMFILVFNDPENQKGEGGWHPICGAPSAWQQVFNSPLLRFNSPTWFRLWTPTTKCVTDHLHEP